MIKDGQTYFKSLVVSRPPIFLTIYAPTPQNGQIQSHNSPAVANELFECV